ncbi:MAG: glycosyltransferase family 2 protein [Candidatus Omnitrophica bacterium]|nr:glycosyltransferase family 2 protein [Candidatus Omnitrophota bacterium]
MSVIIPTFNRKEVLGRAIRSVLSQRVSASFELILADDGSTDGTDEALRKEFPGITCLRWEDQKGPSYARNRAAEIAKGYWLAFLDSDDEWKPGKLKAQLAFFKSQPDYRICQTEEIWIRSGVRVNPMKKHQKFGGFIFEQCLPLCIISPSAVMLEKKLFTALGGFDEALPACEDYDLWLRIAAHHPVGLIDKPYLLKYGGHADQRSREFPAMDRFRIYALQKIIASQTLTPEQTLQALAMLDQKTQVVLTGALKRQNTQEAAQMETLRRQHAFGVSR